MLSLPESPSTSFARLTPSHARLLLYALLVTALGLVAITCSPLQSGFADSLQQRPSDVWLYKAEVDRIHQGEGYYSAVAEELTSRGYPTQSVFNWRMPLPVWLLGVLPNPLLGKAMLGAIALAVLVLAFGVISDESGPRQGILTAVLLTGATMPVLLGDLYVMPPLWSGLLIALSLCAYARDWRKLAIGSGLAALFVRELAAPYVLVAMGEALWHRRWRELAAWTLGLAGFALYFGWHAHFAMQAMPADGISHAEGWLQWGGWPFVISTSQMNAYLLLLPQWVTALYLVAALTGLASWNSAIGERCCLTVVLFLVAFAAVGHDFNQYWGSMFAPLLCFGVARFPASLRDLRRQAFFEESVSAVQGQPSV